MRFLTAPHTRAEREFRKFTAYNILAATATALGASAAVATAAGTVGAGLLVAGGTKLLEGSAPGYQSPSLQEAQQLQQSLIQNAAQDAMQYAPAFTSQNISLQNKVAPGSSAQREKALNQLNAYIEGQIPQDVQQNIQREVAQNLAGGFNAFTGGGQAPQNFARNLGQTSLGLSQYGLSAAPTWQQLANQMVASPTQLFGPALQAGEFSTSSAQSQAENQYQAQMNQWAAQQAQTQGVIQAGMGGANLGIGLMNANTLANYYGGLASATSPTAMGEQTTLMGAGYQSPLQTQISQLPSLYSGSPGFSSVANPASSFYSNPFGS
jgi:hypothetical protein